MIFASDVFRLTTGRQHRLSCFGVGSKQVVVAYIDADSCFVTHLAVVLDGERAVPALSPAVHLQPGLVGLAVHEPGNVVGYVVVHVDGCVPPPRDAGEPDDD